MTQAVRIAVGTGPKNLLGAAALADLKGRIEDALSRGAPMALVGAEGDRYFCGGLDLDDLVTLPTPAVRAVFVDLLAVTRMVFEAPVPVLTLANGHAVGVGAMLALASDRTILSRRAKIRFPEVAIGLGTLPDIVDLIRFRTSGRTAELMAAHGLPIAAETAVAQGLADGVADEPAALEAELGALVDGLDLKAFAAAKAVCRRGVLAHDPDAQLDGFMPQWAAFSRAPSHRPQ